MRQVLIREGQAVVQEMPTPRCGDGDVLVSVHYSLISTGTELTTLSDSAPPAAGQLWTRRLRKAGELARMAAVRGPEDAWRAAEARMEGTSVVTGYSLAGVVLETGGDVTDIVPGTRVACAGAAAAHHAELVAVPRLLVAAVPAALPLDHAAFVTLGAIAMQGVRQADVRLGELVCVVGLGLLGQITVALLRASGCRVFGVDLDSRRIEAARHLGLEAGWQAGADDVERAVDHATGGRGADAVVVTAAASSAEPLQQAVRLVRRKGRVVLVGAVKIELDRGPFYMKEVELRISCSYGPGRYDPGYELEGRDYPYGYVRWTENRNMEEFLRLAAAGAMPLTGLLERTVPLDEAPLAYRSLGEGPADERPLAILLRYPAAEGDAPQPAFSRSVDVVPRRRGEHGLGVALVGPGHFASDVHLPNLAALAPKATLRAVVGRTANSAREAARRFAAAYAATELDEVLRDEAVELILIATRHELHASQAAAALAAGKAVFLEKPAALDRESLDILEASVAAAGRPFVVGFNRRCAPDTLSLRHRLAARRGPLVIDYRVNAGKLPIGHWTLGPLGGGRLIGEACHMIDLLRHLVGHEIVRSEIVPLAPPAGRADLPLGDNFVVTLRYTDGSLSQLTYTSLGNPAAGKERVEAHWDGQSAVIDDFRRLWVAGSPEPPLRPAPDKGQRELLARFIAHVRGEADAPIPLNELFEVGRLVLELDRRARRGFTACDPS
jgi:predicted dehydrogenase/threonine dehydrogenase-like Zn-dependent dehydrogenase